MRTVLAILFVGTTAYAQQVIVPIYPTGEAQETIGTARQMACGRFVLVNSIASATKLAARVSTGYGGGIKFGAAIYPDLDSGPKQLTIDGAGSTGQPPEIAGIVTQTGQTPVSLTGGNTYRACACATGNAGAYAGPRWIGPYFPALQNAFVTSVGRAANDCDPNGVPPSTTGAITANTAFAPPLLVVSVE